jgi:menaquinone-dependent protoporphyrinogen IX oxidase
MRAAIVFFAVNKRDKLLQISKAVAAGIESQGHTVDIVDGAHDVNTRLTVYEYIVIGTETSSSFGGKIPEKVAEFLKSSGMVAGKRCFAFLLKGRFGVSKGLQRLMKVMEGEGMFLKFSEILTSAAEATEIGKRLRIH